MDWQETIKKPIVILRLVQAFVAFLAFILLVTYRGCGELVLNCLKYNKGTHNEEICVQYPFELSTIAVYDYCAEKNTTQSQAVFFLIISICSILVSALAAAFYIRMWEKYHDSTFFALPDLIATTSISAYWLAASFSMSSALSSLKEYTSPETLKETWDSIHSCYAPIGRCAVQQGSIGSYASLDVAVFFGFASIVLWGAQTFFIYRKIREIKETENRRFGNLANVDYPPLPANLQPSQMPTNTDPSRPTRQGGIIGGTATNDYGSRFQNPNYQNNNTRAPY